MCGRVSLTTPGIALAALFGLDAIPELEPRYNIAPGQELAVVRESAPRHRRLTRMRWGLVPGWATSAALGARIINARLEGVASKPAFREAFKARRCLIP